MAKAMYGFSLEKIIRTLDMLVATIKSIDINRQLVDEEKEFLKNCRHLFVQWRKRIHEMCSEGKSNRLELADQFERIEEALCWVLLKRRGLEWDMSDDEDTAAVRNFPKEDNPDGVCGPDAAEEYVPPTVIADVQEMKATDRGSPKAKIGCHLCNGPHVLINCDRYRQMLSSERLRFVQKKLCINCYGPTHTGEDCPSIGRCLRCDAKHHTKLHAGLQRKQQTNQQLGKIDENMN